MNFIIFIKKLCPLLHQFNFNLIDSFLNARSTRIKCFFHVRSLERFNVSDTFTEGTFRCFHFFDVAILVQDTIPLTLVAHETGCVILFIAIRTNWLSLGLIIVCHSKFRCEIPRTFITRGSLSGINLFTNRADVMNLHVSYDCFNKSLKYWNIQCVQFFYTSAKMYIKSVIGRKPIYIKNLVQNHTCHQIMINFIDMRFHITVIINSRNFQCFSNIFTNLFNFIGHTLFSIFQSLDSSE